jgi:hypothetical protein
MGHFGVDVGCGPSVGGTPDCGRHAGFLAGREPWRNYLDKMISVSKREGRQCRLKPEVAENDHCDWV